MSEQNSKAEISEKTKTWELRREEERRKVLQRVTDDELSLKKSLQGLISEVREIARFSLSAQADAAFFSSIIDIIEREHTCEAKGGFSNLNTALPETVQLIGFQSARFIEERETSKFTYFTLHDTLFKAIDETFTWLKPLYRNASIFKKYEDIFLRIHSNYQAVTRPILVTREDGEGDLVWFTMFNFKDSHSDSRLNIPNLEEQVILAHASSDELFRECVQKAVTVSRIDGRLMVALNDYRFIKDNSAYLALYHACCDLIDLEKRDIHNSYRVFVGSGSYYIEEGRELAIKSSSIVPKAIAARKHGYLKPIQMPKGSTGDRTEYEKAIQSLRDHGIPVEQVDGEKISRKILLFHRKLDYWLYDLDTEFENTTQAITEWLTLYLAETVRAAPTNVSTFEPVTIESSLLGDIPIDSVIRCTRTKKIQDLVSEDLIVNMKPFHLRKISDDILPYFEKIVGKAVMVFDISDTPDSHEGLAIPVKMNSAGADGRFLEWWRERVEEKLGKAQDMLAEMANLETVPIERIEAWKGFCEENHLPFHWVLKCMDKTLQLKFGWVTENCIRSIHPELHSHKIEALFNKNQS